MPENITALIIAIAIKVGVLIGILILGAILVSILNKITSAALDKQAKLPELLKLFIKKTLTKVYWVLVLLVALATVGVDIMAFIAGLGVAGFIIGFAFQDTLSNLAAGVMLLVHSPFDVGHFVEAGGQSGSVKEINLSSTVLHSPDNKRVVIPNSGIWGSAIVNYSVLPTRRLSMEVGVSYSTDLTKAKEIVQGIIKKHELCLEDPAPTVELLTMADSSLNLCVRPWVKSADFWTVFFDLNQQIKEADDEAGIEIPFPQRDLHLRDMPEDIFKAMGNKSLEQGAA